MYCVKNIYKMFSKTMYCVKNIYKMFSKTMYYVQNVKNWEYIGDILIVSYKSNDLNFKNVQPKHTRYQPQ